MTVSVNLSAIEDLEPMIRDLVAKQLTGPRWYTLQAACEYKGVTFNTVKLSPLRQPKGGCEDATINGRKMWKASTVEEWCDVTDDNIEDYLRKCRVK